MHIENVGEYLKKNGIKPSIQENEVRYDVVTENHGHFKCKSCGEIMDFDVDLSKFDLSKLGNVEIDEIHFYIKGVCEKCLEKHN